jgi:hypothetical protein
MKKRCHCIEELELIFSSSREATTRGSAIHEDAKGFDENKSVGRVR